jgi:hypothetical protein
MLTHEQCKKIAKKHGDDFTDQELKEIYSLFEYSAKFNVTQFENNATRSFDARTHQYSSTFFDTRYEDHLISQKNRERALTSNPAGRNSLENNSDKFASWKLLQ